MDSSDDEVIVAGADGRTAPVTCRTAVAVRLLGIA